MSLEPYEFVVVPTGPLTGVWMQAECWNRLDGADLESAQIKAVEMCWDASIKGLIRYNPNSDEIVHFKLSRDPEHWAKLMALAAMGLAARGHYDPNKQKDTEETL